MVSFLTVNAERSRHLEALVAFFEKTRPDVVCIQELMERDVPLFEKALGARSVFSTTTRHPNDGNPGIHGIGIFSRLPILSSREALYAGDGVLREFDATDMHSAHATVNRMLLCADIGGEGGMYRIATTHFTWSAHGDPDEYQRADMKHLIGLLEGMGEFVLAGDFNAPRIHNDRPGEIFGMLAERYTDNIPARFTTSIDLDLHRVGHIASERMDQKMVDALFSTSVYAVSDVQMHSGLSDHLAVSAKISLISR